MDLQNIYVFLDEAGDVDFGLKGTRYFVLGCVTMKRPFPLYVDLDKYTHYTSKCEVRTPRLRAVATF